MKRKCHPLRKNCSICPGECGRRNAEFDSSSRYIRKYVYFRGKWSWKDIYKWWEDEKPIMDFTWKVCPICWHGMVYVGKYVICGCGYGREVYID